MSIKWGEALEKGLKFAVYPKRWLPFFALDAIFYSIMLIVVMTNLNMLGAALAVLGGTPVSLLWFGGVALSFIILVGVWNLLKLWLTGAIIHQSRKEKEFCKSYKIAANNYISLLLAAVVMAAVNTVVGTVPYIGLILSILSVLVFFFVLQEIMIGKKGFLAAIESSWKMFRKRPARIFLMWVVITLIGGLIVFIFTLPLILMAVYTTMPYMTEAGVTALAALLAYMITNMHVLVILGGIMLVGTSITTAFVLKATTEFYMQSKKKLGIF